MFVQADKARHQVHSQHSVQTHGCTDQTTMPMRKSIAIFKFKWLKLFFQNIYCYFSGEKDVDWFCNVNNRKSTAANYFKLNGRGAAFDGGIMKQATVAVFSSEAECQGFAAALQKALYLKQI